MGPRAPKFLAISIGTNENVGPVGNRLRPMGLVKNQICGVFDVDNGIGGPLNPITTTYVFHIFPVRTPNEQFHFNSFHQGFWTGAFMMTWWRNHTWQWKNYRPIGLEYISIDVCIYIYIYIVIVLFYA